MQDANVFDESSHGPPHGLAEKNIARESPERVLPGRAKISASPWGGPTANLRCSTHVA